MRLKLSNIAKCFIQAIELSKSGKMLYAGKKC